MKICPVGVALFPADRQTDRWTDVTRLMAAFAAYLQTVNPNIPPLFIHHSCGITLRAAVYQEYQLVEILPFFNP
jgi:hypothetical protein